MGDCLWATPGIRSLKKSFPNVAIDLLIQPQWESLYLTNPHIRKLIFYQPQWYHQFVLLPSLIATYYDRVLLFHGNKDIGRLIRWLRCSEILAHQDLPNILSNQILKFQKPTHPILRRQAIIKKLGATPDGTQMEIFLNDEDRHEARLFLKESQINTKEFLYFNIGASLPHKKWPINRIISLATLFLKKTTFGIILGGGPGDAQAIKEIQKKLDKKRVIHNFHRSLRGNCALIEQASLMITADTGPMHIAFATKTPTVALFGPTRPEDSGPYEIDPKLCQVIRSNAMNNMDHTGADKFIFFDSITVEMVWKKVKLLLNQ